MDNACSSRSQFSRSFENANVDGQIYEKNALDSLYVNHGLYLVAFSLA